jgi:hypothetical protein
MCTGPATLNPPTSGPSTGGQTASGGLKQQWSLKDPPLLNEASSSEQERKFLGSFKAAMEPVNNCLQYTKVNAEQAKHIAMEGKRDYQYADFQATRARIAVDEMQAEQLIQRVLAQAKALADEATKLRQDTEKLLKAWQAKEADYNKSEEQVQELEKWGDKEFPNLRKSGDEIRAATNLNKYEDAVKLLEQHLAKLKPIYDGYLKQKEAKEKYEPALKSLEPRLAQASECKYKKLEPSTTEIANIKKQMEEAAQNKDFVKALQLVTDLTTKVDAYLKALQELEEKKKAYETSLGELKPKLAEATQLKNPAVADMQKEMLAVQGQMESAAQSGDYDQATKLLADLRTKVKTILETQQGKGTGDSIGYTVLKTAAGLGALGAVGVVVAAAGAIEEGIAGAGALGPHGGTSPPGGAPPPTAGGGSSPGGGGGTGGGGGDGTNGGDEPPSSSKPNLGQKGTGRNPDGSPKEPWEQDEEMRKAAGKQQRDRRTIRNDPDADDEEPGTIDPDKMKKGEQRTKKRLKDIKNRGDLDD